MILRCPNCDSSQCFYVEKAINYWWVDHISTTDIQGITLGPLENHKNNDDGFFECQDCLWCISKKDYFKIYGNS